MSTPKKIFNRSGVINIDNSETFPILNVIFSKEKKASRKDNQIVSVPEKELPQNTPGEDGNRKNSNTLITRIKLITQNLSSY